MAAAPARWCPKTAAAAAASSAGVAVARTTLRTCPPFECAAEALLLARAGPAPQTPSAASRVLKLGVAGSNSRSRNKHRTPVIDRRHMIQFASYCNSLQQFVCTSRHPGVQSLACANPPLFGIQYWLFGAFLACLQRFRLAHHDYRSILLRKSLVAQALTGAGPLVARACMATRPLCPTSTSPSSVQTASGTTAATP